MIKFFRGIRQQLLSDPPESTGKVGSGNKFSKYLLYAIGEIVLVVIGILIALSINNWNEDRKKEHLKREYLISLKRDLKSDLSKLNDALIYAENDINKNLAYSSRLSSPNATTDTLIKIARYEFNPIIGGLKELKQSTYNSLNSTGNIDLLGKELTEQVQEHYAIQSNSLFFIRTNFESYIGAVNAYFMHFPMNIKYNAINGPLQDSFWEGIDSQILQSEFNGILSGRIFMFNNEKTQIIILMEQTEELILLIESSVN